MSVLSDQPHGADGCEGRPDHDVGTSRERYGGDLDLETGEVRIHDIEGAMSR